MITGEGRPRHRVNHPHNGCIWMFRQRGGVPQPTPRARRELRDSPESASSAQRGLEKRTAADRPTAPSRRSPAMGKPAGATPTCRSAPPPACHRPEADLAGGRLSSRAADRQSPDRGRPRSERAGRGAGRQGRSSRGSLSTVRSPVSQFAARDQETSRCSQQGFRPCRRLLGRRTRGRVHRSGHPGGQSLTTANTMRRSGR